MAKVQVGDMVTTRASVEAYYSGYGGQPVQFFTPGTVGIVGAVDVPAVTSNKTFCCVDFYGADGRVWRVALYPWQVKKVTFTRGHTS